MSTTTKEQTGNKKASTPGGKKAANFVIQGSILAIAGIVVRLIGMLYRIPLINITGKREMDTIRPPTASTISC